MYPSNKQVTLSKRFKWKFTAKQSAVVCMQSYAESTVRMSLVAQICTLARSLGHQFSARLCSLATE